MGLFRKKPTLNEQMLRDAGLDRVVFTTPEPAPEEQPPEQPPAEVRAPRFRVDPSIVGGEWDTTTTVLVPGIAGDGVQFTTLPNGDLIVTSGDADDDLAPFADAIEEHVPPPYKAIATRQEGDVWGVGAKRIEVEQFQFPDADALELAQTAGVSEFDADGESSDATPPPELQRVGERLGGDFCVEAWRIDGDYWEVRASLL